LLGRRRLVDAGGQANRVLREPGDQVIDDLAGIRDVEGARGAVLVHVQRLVRVRREQPLHQLFVLQQARTAGVQRAAFGPVLAEPLGIALGQLAVLDTAADGRLLERRLGLRRATIAKRR
jgi:hypothetical protein